MNGFFIVAAVYGTLVGGNMVKAPYIVKADGANRVTAHLSEEVANSVGYKLVVDTPPACASNEYAVATGWVEDARITRTYEKRTIEPSPRCWTPLSIKRSAYALGRWETLKSFLQTAGAYDDFIMAQYEAEDDPQFVLLMNAARAQFGDEWVNEVLDNAEVEP